MKKAFSFFILFTLFIGVKVNGQSTADSLIVKQFLLNFSVPDMPAFKALDVNPSNILRPSDIQKAAVMISPFYTQGGTIPKNFALEISPFKLFSDSVKVDEYEATGMKAKINRGLYNSGFSIGTNQDTTAYSNKVAIGYRISFQGEKSILNQAKVKSQMGFAKTRSQLKAEIRRYMIERNLISDTATTSFDEYFDKAFKDPKSIEDPEIKKRISTEKQKMIDTYGARSLLELRTRLLDDYMKHGWNYNRFDLGFAWVGQSSDSAVKNIQFGAFNLWAVWGIKLGKAAQLLIGDNFKAPRSTTGFTGINSVNSRLYVGTCDIRFFFEAQWTRDFNTDLNKYLGNLGGEIRLQKDFWVVLNLGPEFFDQGPTASRFVSAIDIRYGFNK